MGLNGKISQAMLRSANRFILRIGFHSQATPKASLIEHSLFLPILIFLGIRPSDDCHRYQVVKHFSRSVLPGRYSHLLPHAHLLGTLPHRPHAVKSWSTLTAWQTLFLPHDHLSGNTCTDSYIADRHRFGVLAQEHCLRYLVMCRIPCPTILISNQ